jgi:predicted acyltransferase (DUF342 family)
VFGSDPLDELVIPDGTHVKEHDLVTDGDVLIGGQSVVELGVRGGAVVAGERVTIGGDIEADGDCRLDMWCDVDGNVLVGSDAYLGERVHIAGQLIVSGDLDIGDDVDIEEGFEANGWIVIRNPMPTIVFLFTYLSHLLRIGEEEAAEEVADEFLSSDREAEPAKIPRGARVSDDAWRVSTDARIGDGCRLHGNIRAESIDVGTDTEVFGSLRAKGTIRVRSGAVIHGDVTTRSGDVTIEPEVHVRGDISCDGCVLSEAADVDGTIRAREGITFTDGPEAGTPDDGEDVGTPDHDGSEPETPDSEDGSEEGIEDDAPESTDGPRAEDSSQSEGIDKSQVADPQQTEISGEVDASEGTETSEPAFVPLNEAAGEQTAAESPDGDAGGAEKQPETLPAIRPIEDGKLKWDSVDGTNRSKNGTAEDVSAIITDAEEP